MGKVHVFGAPTQIHMLASRQHVIDSMYSNGIGWKNVALCSKILLGVCSNLKQVVYTLGTIDL